MDQVELAIDLYPRERLEVDPSSAERQSSFTSPLSLSSLTALFAGMIVRIVNAAVATSGSPLSAT